MADDLSSLLLDEQLPRTKLHGVDIWSVPDINDLAPDAVPYRPQDRERFCSVQKSTYQKVVEQSGTTGNCTECGAQFRVHPIIAAKTTTCGRNACQMRVKARRKKEQRTCTTT